MQQPTLPPHKVAFVIDDSVVEVLHVDTRLAAILLSEPVMVDVTDILLTDPHAVRAGTSYDSATGEFVNPVTPEA